jgi:ribokinase
LAGGKALGRGGKDCPDYLGALMVMKLKFSFNPGFDVISLGTATLDVFLKSLGMEIETDEPEKEICVRYGAKLEVSEIHFETGGGGTNSAVTFARQGLKVACVTQIGDDFAGRRVLEDLKKEGVVTKFLHILPRHQTDYSTVLWVPDGGRTILIYRGPTRLEKENIPWSKLKTRWFYVGSLEGNLEIVRRLISDFPQTKIAWNPGGRELKQRKEILELLPKITVLNLNKEEMMELLAFSSQPSAVSSLLKKAQQLPCRYIVITDDRKGAHLWDREEKIWWHSGIFEESPRVETLGAGDSFGSGLVTGLIKNWSIEDCLWLATANASSVVTKVGAKKGILTEKDLASWSKEKLSIEKISI